MTGITQHEDPAALTASSLRIVDGAGAPHHTAPGRLCAQHGVAVADASVS
jgi:hypothetical protein